MGEGQGEGEGGQKWNAQKCQTENPGILNFCGECGADGWFEKGEKDLSSLLWNLHPRKDLDPFDRAKSRLWRPGVKKGGSGSTLSKPCLQGGESKGWLLLRFGILFRSWINIIQTLNYFIDPDGIGSSVRSAIKPFPWSLYQGQDRWVRAPFYRTNSLTTNMWAWMTFPFYNRLNLIPRHYGLALNGHPWWSPEGSWNI